MKGAAGISSSVYEIIALAARYFFTAIMLLIVARAWKITIVDSRRAASLRRLSPETGVCGEFLVVQGHGRAKDGMRYPVIREGLIGSSRKADIRLRSSSVRRVHAFFELTPKGLRLRAQRGARLFNARGNARRELLLGDGSRVTIGEVELLLILTEAVDAPVETQDAGLFDVPDDSPILAHRPESRRAAPAEPEAAQAAPEAGPGEPKASPFRRPDFAPAPETQPFRRPDSAPAPETQPLRRPDFAPAPETQPFRRPDFAPAPETLPSDAQKPAANAPRPAYPEAPDDLFLDGTAGTLRPGTNGWDADSENMIPWDDWDSRPRKRAVKKRPSDDDLFGI